MAFNVAKFTESLTQLSKDQSTKIGATLTNQYGSIVSYGYNGLPRGMNDANMAYQNKEKGNGRFYKYDLFEHAERNCLYNYAKNNTELKDDGTFAIISHIRTMEDFRALISLGIKNIFYKSVSQTLDIHVCNHMADETKTRLVCVQNNAQDFGKISKLFNVFENSFEENSNDFSFCAFFNKDFSMISMGTFGFSDYMKLKIKHAINHSNNKLRTNLLKEIESTGFYKGYSMYQSAVKNAIYNLLVTHFVDNVEQVSKYQLNVTLQPCIHCAIGLFSCGLWLSLGNIVVTEFSKTITTSQRWGIENQIAIEFENLILG